MSSTDRGLLTHAGEHTASGFLPSSFGAKDADNALDSESARGEKWLEGDVLANGGTYGRASVHTQELMDQATPSP